MKLTPLKPNNCKIYSRQTVNFDYKFWVLLEIEKQENGMGTKFEHPILT